MEICLYLAQSLYYLVQHSGPAVLSLKESIGLHNGSPVGVRKSARLGPR